jgi:hypothetical protein
LKELLATFPMPFQQNKQKTAILMQKAFETIAQLAADHQIKKAVYQLYGLTEEEIKIVGGNEVNNYSDDILKNPTLLPAIMSCACEHCLYVDNELDFSPTRICPNCGKTGTRKLFQKYNIHYFLEMIQRLYLKDEPQAIVLTVCAMLERLVEDLLFQIMRKNNLKDDEIDSKLFVNWRLDDRAKDLFKEYAKLTLAQAIEAIPKKDFWQTWKDLREKRDGFMYGVASAINSPDCKKSFKLALEAQHVFSQIHNRYGLLS